MYEIYRNGEKLAEVETPNKAFGWLLRNQGQSVHYALKYGGYSVKNMENGRDPFVSYDLNPKDLELYIGEIKAKLQADQWNGSHDDAEKILYGTVAQAKLVDIYFLYAKRIRDELQYYLSNLSND